MLAIDFEQNSDIILLSAVEEALAVSDGWHRVPITSLASREAKYSPYNWLA